MKPQMPNTPAPGHEVTQWRSRPFIIGVFCFFLLMGVILFVVGGLTVSWTHQSWPPTGPVAGPQSDSRWNNKAPQLQINGDVDLAHLRQREYQRLHTVNWTDDSCTYASIPIDRAMSLMVQAEANHQLNQLLPEPKPATSIELQNQKSGTVAPAPKSP